MILAFSFSTAKECAYLSIPLSHLQGEFGHAVQEDRSGEETRRWKSRNKGIDVASG